MYAILESDNDNIVNSDGLICPQIKADSLLLFKTKQDAVDYIANYIDAEYYDLFVVSVAFKAV